MSWLSIAALFIGIPCFFISVAVVAAALRMSGIIKDEPRER